MSQNIIIQSFQIIKIENTNQNHNIETNKITKNDEN